VKNSRTKSGYGSRCKKCHASQCRSNPEHRREYLKKYNEENREKILEQKREYYQENKEELLKKDKIRREKNKEKISLRNKIRYEANKEEIKAKSKKHREENPEYYKEYLREYNQTHKEEIKEKKREYYLANKEHINALNRARRLEHLEEIREYNRQYYQDNKEIIKEKNRQYGIKNREIISERNKRYRQLPEVKKRRSEKEKERKKNDICFKLRGNISKSVNKAIKRSGNFKGGSILQYLPNTIQELKEHLEKQFDSWMSWDNYGMYDPKRDTWNIDHIIPHSSFHYETMDCDEFRKCWALENLRPLKSIDNIRKGKKIDFNFCSKKQEI
jgi:hypothetical protein